jgi:hypothetical protein
VVIARVFRDVLSLLTAFLPTQANAAQVPIRVLSDGLLSVVRGAVDEDVENSSEHDVRARGTKSE